jgi:hypothetical protein
LLDIFLLASFLVKAKGVRIIDSSTKIEVKLGARPDTPFVSVASKAKEAARSPA